MRKIICAAAVIAFAFALGACHNRNEAYNGDIDRAHNSRNSLDWEGTYGGIIPCADCEGIKVEIVLTAKETYKMSQKYLGKKGPAFKSGGKFTWDKTGGIITLDTKDSPPHYIVGENKLIQLDMEGKPIKGKLAPMYQLTKKD